MFNRYFIHLAYKGTHYGGWQIQPNVLTIQEKIETGLLLLASHKNGVVGCGRTDAGVSASDFFCHFESEITLLKEECEQLVYKLNRFLPNDIVVFSIEQVASDVHARFSAVWREYEYKIILQKDPFLFEDAFLVHGNFDIELMNDCAQLLIGSHDFECFSKVNTQVNNFRCNVQYATFKRENHVLTFSIRADRFLRNMVRAIVGTLLDVGKGRTNKNDFQNIIESRNRCKAGYSVPAHGLTLTKVQYPDGIYLAK